MTHRRTALLVLAGAALLGSCGKGATPPSYPTPAAGAALGVAYDAVSGQATFRVWAPAAKSAAVVFLDPAGNATGSAPLAQDLTSGGTVDGNGWNGVWQATVPSVVNGQLYQYSLDGHPALDPYAPSMGLFDSSTMSVGRGAVLDPSTISPEDLSTGLDTAWVPFTAPDGYAKREDAVIYEIHVRDDTIALPQGAGGVTHAPGTYEALAERLPYLEALGVTHVQLLPVLAYYYGDESLRAKIESTPSTQNNNYNWGYDPQSWFAPDGMYSDTPGDPLRRVRELKTLVNEAHRLGLGVILDVVYNHTATTQILDALAPDYFYRGTNSSGTGNDTASEKKMMRKLIVDSIAYLTAQYRVDGFRFDLMGLIDSATITEAWQAAHARNPDILFIGEGWRMSGVPSTDYLGNSIVPANQDWMASNDMAAAFSDSYRDLLKGGGLSETSDTNTGFLTSALPGAPVVDKTALLRNLRGDPTNFTAGAPGNAVQYMTVHDGLTLHDKIAKVLRLDPTSQQVYDLEKVGYAMLATSQGIAFLHGGCEMGRTKQVSSSLPNSTSGNFGSVYYVYNSYDSSDAVNELRWSPWMAAGSPGQKLSQYVAGLLALRRSSDAFRLGSKTVAGANVTTLDGNQPYAYAYQLVDSAGTTHFSVFVNAGNAPAVLLSGHDLTSATPVVDDDEAGSTPVVTPSGYTIPDAAHVSVNPRTAIVFRW